MKVSISKINTEYLLKGSQTIDYINRSNLVLNKDQLAGDDQKLSPSQLVNKVIERYYLVVRASLPIWPQELWGWVLNAFNGYSQFPIRNLPYMVTNVAEDMGIEYDVHEALLSRAKTLQIDLAGELNPLFIHGEYNDDFAALWALFCDINPGQSLAIAEVVERFWGNEAEPRELRLILSDLSGRYKNNVFLGDKPEWSIVEVQNKEIAGAQSKLCRFALDDDPAIQCMIEVGAVSQQGNSAFEWKIVNMELPAEARPFRQDLSEQALRAFGRCLTVESLDELCPAD